MRAVGLDFTARKLLEWETSEPTLENSRQVLYRILEVGICGTDRELTGFRLGSPPPNENRLILGHEALGQVIEAGSDARLRPGDLVVPTVRRACSPPCYSCRRERRDLCISGAYTERGITAAHGYFTELAVDQEADLVLIPASLAEFAILLEPLSVVEKAIRKALALHEGEPTTALVIGAGSIGLLTAMALRRRGLAVTVLSIESKTSGRAALVRKTGAEYVNDSPPGADLIIEAAGSGQAFAATYPKLNTLGVLIVLGAPSSGSVLGLAELIVGNLIIAGSVNAAPYDFKSAVDDLVYFPIDVLNSMISRDSFSQLLRSLSVANQKTPKLVFSL